MKKEFITVNNKKIKIGDIFVCRWGYEQTNVDFYQVINVKGTKTVELREIKTEIIERGDLTGKVIPCKDKFLEDSEKLNRRILSHNNSIFIRINSFSDASLHENGKSYYFSNYH